jgi:hypothetical protein
MFNGDANNHEIEGLLLVVNLLHYSYVYHPQKLVVDLTGGAGCRRTDQIN